MKSIVIVALAIVAIIGGAVIFSSDDDVAGAVSNNFYGQETGIVTVTEFGDFECPGCGAFAPIVAQVKESFKDQIRFEFRHFPLVQIHANATAAHRAAQAAANQGKFWEMHDLLYSRQNAWNSQSGTTNPSSVFESYAQELDLDIETYTTDAAASETLGVINADIDLGKDSNVAATPTFIIDGELVTDSASISTVESFSAAIQSAIDAKEVSAEDTTPAPEETPATVPEETTAE